MKPAPREEPEFRMSETACRASRMMKLLGNPLRYRLVRLLQSMGPASSRTLADRLDRTVSSVSHHLARMKQLDLVYARREGRSVLYDLKRHDVLDAMETMEAILERPHD